MKQNNWHLRINTLEDKLINDRVTLYGYILGMNKERITQEDLNMKIKGKCPRGRLRTK
jgi:hypothetical protein